MKYIFLTKKFYDDYSDYPEIEARDRNPENRPYVQVYTKIGEYIFAIPLRSNINHCHVLWTNKIEGKAKNS